MTVVILVASLATWLDSAHLRLAGAPWACTLVNAQSCPGYGVLMHNATV